MVTREAYNKGKEIGEQALDSAYYSVLKICRLDGGDVGDMSDLEQYAITVAHNYWESYRDDSDGTFICYELNNAKYPEKCWEAFDRGVIVGAIQEFKRQYKERN